MAAALACAVIGSALGIGPTSPRAATAERGPSLVTLGLGGWRVQSSALATQTGEQISAPDFPARSWLAVKPDDAGAPGTEIEALLQNGACPRVFFSTRMKQCFGYQDRIGSVTQPRFAVPWWFRTEFSAGLRAGDRAALVVNGIVGAADLWVNGEEIASRATIQGAFTRYSFDVTRLLQARANVLAVEVYPNNPLRMYTLDNVDWTQIPPDNNTGIRFPVQLSLTRGLGIGNAHVTQQDAADLSVARLTVKTDITNPGSTSRSGLVVATLTPPSEAGSPITVERVVTIPPSSTQSVIFDPGRYAALTVRHPRVWWPYQLGRQALYTLNTSVRVDAVQSDAPIESFGIRTVGSRLTGPSAIAPQGVRIYSVNGTPLLIRAGGWSENLFLHYSASDIATQLRLLKSAGLNAVRTEGHEMPDNFYTQFDRAGVLVDAGYQCCDKWEPGSSKELTAKDYAIMELSARTIGTNLRDHPSVFTFSWSDNAPLPRQEAVSLGGFAQADFEAPLVASAEYRSSPRLGPSGEKEGPYDWVPPSYWYDTAHGNPGDSTLTNAGGSWGFDSEQSAGDTVPTLDSMARFMSAQDQRLLWTEPSFNQYHTNYEPGHRGYAFGTLFNLDVAIRKRYGAWADLARYVEEAQLQNYEDTRAQFEAVIDHWTHRPTPATGTVYWQLNKGWPSLLWTLYNQDYDLAGSYFGAKKANETLHAFYAPDTGTVTVDNLGASRQSDLSVTASVHSLEGTLLDQQSASLPALPSQAVANGVLRPHVPATTTPPVPARTYFVEVSLHRHGVVVDRNVYWLSTQRDIVDWAATIGNPQATMRQYADMRALNRLATATISVALAPDTEPGRTVVTITNTSSSPTVGLFLRADVRRNGGDAAPARTGATVLPITWSDNDITLWPGESQTLRAAYDPRLLGGTTPVVTVSGWNVAQMVVAAGPSSQPNASSRDRALQAG